MGYRYHLYSYGESFFYFTGLIDYFSRYLVGWSLHNTLEKETQAELLERLFDQYQAPKIINSDQGSQYTCEHWEKFNASREVKISMTGKGRATDNVFIERFFRSLKYDHVYVKPTSDAIELYQGIEDFVNKYNNRSHQGIDRQKPASLFFDNFSSTKPLFLRASLKKNWWVGFNQKSHHLIFFF